MRSFASVDELSEEGLRTIKSTTIDEARPLLKELLVSLVKQHVDTDSFRVKVKEMEAELKKKDAILKAFLSKGASLSDTAPAATEASPQSSFALEIEDLHSEPVSRKATSPPVTVPTTPSYVAE